MADERDDQASGNDNSAPTTGQDSDKSEYGARGAETMNNQGAEGSFGGQSTGDQSGSADANGSTVAGGANAGQGSSDDGMSGQPIGGNDSNTGTGTTLTQGADFGDSSKGGDGFILQQGGGAERTGAATGDVGGTDFANEGRGALEDEDDETVSNETGFSGSGDSD